MMIIYKITNFQNQNALMPYLAASQSAAQTLSMGFMSAPLGGQAIVAVFIW